MFVCISQLTIELFILILNFGLILITLNYNQGVIDYKKNSYKIIISFIPMILVQLYTFTYFKTFSLLPLNSYIMISLLLLVINCDISKGLLSFLFVILCLVNPVLIISTIINLFVTCETNYSYILLAFILISILIIVALTIITISSDENIIDKFLNVVNIINNKNVINKNEYLPINDDKDEILTTSQLEEQDENILS